MKQQNDFYQILIEIGVPDTRIVPIIRALNDLNDALMQCDELVLKRIKFRFGSIDEFFRSSQNNIGSDVF